MSGRGGFTLVELLVALAVGGILFGLLGPSLAAGRKYSAELEAKADTNTALRLAAELLSEELRLAGSVPWPVPVGLPGVEPDPLAWLAPALTLTARGPGHAIGMRAVDHRGAAGLVPRDLTFEVGTDARGEAQLYRRPSGASKQPLVEQVEALRVAWVIDAAGVRLPPYAADGSRLAALGVEVMVAGVIREFVVELPSRPLVTVGALP